MIRTRSLDRIHPRRAAVGVIRVYQRFVSPGLGANCRYLPTCSSFAIEAIGSHGLLRGSWLAIRRVGRCHPFREGGYDPVPPTRGAGAGEHA